LNIKFPKSEGVPHEKINPILLKEYTMQKNESSAKSAKDIVMEYIEALERRDFQSARSYISDNISYVSPLNSFDRAEPYLKYNEHLNLPKFDIKKIFTDGDDVCILHETNLTKPPATVFTSLWFHVDGGKISSLRALFDPRPFLQQK
jgi:SnoaL-like domain